MSSKKAKPSTRDVDQEALWTPRRRGKTYCSPACGGGCTWDEHRRAYLDACSLAASLRGRGWKPLVYENLGWHFRAVSGPVQVYGDRRGEGGAIRYSCLISDSCESPSGGSVLWTTKDRAFTDPNRAVEHELRSAMDAAVRICAAVGAASLAAGRSRRWTNRLRAEVMGRFES